MTRLSLLMGLFMSVTVTGIVMLLAMLAQVSASTIIFRGIIVFFIFGTLGTVLGSFLEILLMPETTEKESEKLQAEILFEDENLLADLGDLLDDNKSDRQYESIGTPTDETGQPNDNGVAINAQSHSATAS